MEDGIISEPHRNYGKWPWTTKSDFGCYDRSEGKPVHVDVDKEMAESNEPTLVLLPNKWEENKINNNSETRDRDGKKNLRRSNRIFKPPGRLGSVPYF